MLLRAKASTFLVYSMLTWIISTNHVTCVRTTTYTKFDDLALKKIDRMTLTGETSMFSIKIRPKAFIFFSPAWLKRCLTILATRILYSPKLAWRMASGSLDITNFVA